MKSFRDYLDETIRRYGPAGNSPGMGYTLEDEGEGQLVAKTLELEPTGPTSGVIDEGQMSEADVLIQDIVNGTANAYNIMTRPKTPVERYVAQILDNMYDTAAIDHGLHPDDKFEEIMEIVVERLADEYGHSNKLSESSQELYRVLELANVNKGKQ
jgi:hypothetical protein